MWALEAGLYSTRLTRLKGLLGIMLTVQRHGWSTLPGNMHGMQAMQPPNLGSHVCGGDEAVGQGARLWSGSRLCPVGHILAFTVYVHLEGGADTPQPRTPRQLATIAKIWNNSQRHPSRCITC